MPELTPMPTPTAEHRRLAGDPASVARWRRWGPYVSERSWGTVREDYSADGNAWEFLSHDQARAKAYRWGEDGLAAICDRYQILVFGLALWNGRDPILKERLFGLTPAEANHGEDVKECYFYLDNVPTHAYMRFLYKYPQTAFPYAELIEENRRRSPAEPEYELLETGAFAEDRYFDVSVEYAKAAEEDIAIRITVWNRGPDAATIHVIPQLWFRNTWSWTAKPNPQPRIELEPGQRIPNVLTLVADDTSALPPPNLGHIYRLGPRYLSGEASATPLFTDNETNGPAVYGAAATSRSAYTKDAFHRAIVAGERGKTNPLNYGTKACLQQIATIEAGGRAVFRLRLSDTPKADPLSDIDRIIDERKAEADAFYDTIHPPQATLEERAIQRQALAGMLWSKQVYLFDVARWLDGDSPLWPPPATRHGIRNRHWRHLNSMRVLSMPDKWEYPWFAAWDLAFHAVALALVDPEFAKEQLWLMLFEQFQHPNGQLPACEWEFTDTNPPVHAWAVWRVYSMDRARSGRADRDFLERCFQKLLLNFTWWVNKVDREGNNVFEGGFLGLDNICITDRSDPFPGGAVLAQADATGWMGMYCLNLMRIALELARENPVYEALAVKFFEHYVYIGAAMKHMGGRDYQLWNEEDGFFYDVLRFPDGRFETFRVRSLVGLVPLFAIEHLDRDELAGFPEFRESFDWFLANRQDMVDRCATTLRHDNRIVHALSIVDQAQLRRLLALIWDEDEFLSPYGLRSLSKVHAEHPYVFGEHVVHYEPGDAQTSIKGGNSNWRGPVWFPMSFMMIEALLELEKAYGTEFDLGLTDAQGQPLTFERMAAELANRLIAIFTPDSDGRRPVFGTSDAFRCDPHWRDLTLFYEYFHGDTGRGLGASHQTGWTGLVANLIDEWRRQ